MITLWRSASQNRRIKLTGSALNTSGAHHVDPASVDPEIRSVLRSFATGIRQVVGARQLVEGGHAF